MNGPIKSAWTALRALPLAVPAPTDIAVAPTMSSAMGRSVATELAKASVVARDAKKPQIAASISKPCAACWRLKNGMAKRGYSLRPNVRAKRATTAGRQARAGENVPRTTSPGLVACRWRSA